LSDVFAVQAEVAEAVAKSLAVELLPEQQIARSKAPPESAAAYDAYLLGRSYWAKRTPESLRTAIKHFKHAIELDPNYALAYCGLADAWSVMPYYVPGPYNKINAEAMKAAKRALVLNGSLAEAHVSMAGILADHGDWETANEHYEKAVAIDPNNATAHQWYGGVLSYQERYDQADEEYEKAIALDPLSAVIHNKYGDGSVLARRFDKAIEQCNTALRLQPEFKNAYVNLTWAYIGNEDHNAAAKAFESFLRFTNRPTESINAFRRTFDASGLRVGFLEWLDSLGSDFDSWGAEPARRASFYAWCNEKDSAFDSLDRAMQQGNPLFYRFATYFPYDNLRDDPRYADLLERIAAKSRTEKVQPQP
jgi:tetratricopeptide (TPR) repeat protein